jgi:hypothetical protein
VAPVTSLAESDSQVPLGNEDMVIARDAPVSMDQVGQFLPVGLPAARGHHGRPVTARPGVAAPAGSILTEHHSRGGRHR